MEAKLDVFKKHQSAISVVLKDVCQLTNAGQLVQETNLSITLCGVAPARQVTTDFGNIGAALPLPIPNVDNPRYWVGLHENWRAKNRHKVEFVDCGLRLYVGSREEEALQLIRLEWVAPTKDANGDTVYSGKHAGHPHWHIDKTALAGPDDYWRSLERLTAPELVNAGPEDFGDTVAGDMIEQPHTPYDCTWLDTMHLPAHAKWMGSKWDGRAVPGPHQSDVLNVEALEFWWNGALRYFASELPG